MMYGRACKQYVFQVAFLLLLLLFLLLFSITSDFNAMRFNDNPFTCQCEKEKKMLTVFKHRTYIGRF